MWSAISNLFRVETLRKKIFLTLSLLFVYRVGFQIPIPGVDRQAFADFVNQAAGDNTAKLVGLMNALSGGNLNAPVIMALGILPYITSSIVFSLLVKVVPSLEELSKEGASGQKKINQYSRLLTVPLCLFQGTAICYGLFSNMISPVTNAPVIPDFGLTWVLMAVLAMTAGTIFLMWIGEQITAHGIGNGISLLIMAGIVSDLPRIFLSLGERASEDRQVILYIIILLAVYVGVVIGVVYMTKGQRRIPIQQAKLMKGRRMVGGAKHYLPVKLNMANVMPVIFASALLTLPSIMITWISGDQSGGWLAYGGWLWIVVFSSLIFFFSYFWTSLMFQPADMANNLKEYGSFVPGIRPGKKTAEFLEKVMVRITLVGAAYLSIIAIIPILVSNVIAVDAFVASFVGGTGLLIVVGVTLDLVDQLNANLLQRDYEGFMSGGSSRRGARR